MADAAPALPGPWLGAVRRSRMLMVAATCATGVLAPVGAASYGPGRLGAAALWWSAAALVVIVHLYHAFGMVAGMRPRGWPLTMVLLTVLVYLPMVWSPRAWGISQVFLIASAALMVRGWLRSVCMAAPVLATVTVVAAGSRSGDHLRSLAGAAEVAVVLTVLSGCLVGVAVLARAVACLGGARARIAEQSAARERLRVSRDLHDLVGQSLSAVALKSELAAGMLGSDPVAAQAEIRAIASLASDTLRSTREMAAGEHTISFRNEVAGALDLLRAAGIDARQDIVIPPLAPATDRALAWTVREGITNVLRHSAARTCTIAAGVRAGKAWLEISNDEPFPGRVPGNGLSGLIDRAAVLAGTVTARSDGAGIFRLYIEIPEAAE